MKGGSGDEMHAGQSGSLRVKRVSEFEQEQSELIKEIMALERERKDLLGSLTPTLSRWEHDQQIQSSQAATTWRKVYRASVSSYKTNSQYELGDYFDSILEDVTDLGHRLLSMTHVVVDESNDPMDISSLSKVHELVSRMDKLLHVSGEFYGDTNEGEDSRMDKLALIDEEEEEIPCRHVDDFLFLCHNYFSSHNNKNELVLILTEEKKKAMKVYEVKEKDVTTMEFLKMVTSYYQNIFADHRACWERVRGSNIGRCGSFGDTTTLSSMQFTHYTPDTFPSPAAALSGSTLQIYSIKIWKLNPNLNWPIKVYGIVAARDTVDRNRNILFLRSKRDYQVLTEDDPFLRLTGPSRAILAVDPVEFEFKLKINRDLITGHQSYSAMANALPSLHLQCSDYSVELGIERLATPLQATIVGVRVVEGVWPFEHGCRVVCFSYAAAEDTEIPTPRGVVLLDYHGEIMRAGSDGYLHLSRSVVSVEFYGRIRVLIHAYKESGCQAQGNHVDFPAQHCQTSKRELSVGNSKLEIVVAWSLLVKEKLDILVDCPPQP